MRKLVTCVIGVITLAMALISCTSSPSTPAKPPDLFYQFITSDNVKGVEPSGVAPEDRLANLASMGSRSDLESELLGAFRCDEISGDGPFGKEMHDGCPANQSVVTAATESAGPGNAIIKRDIVVKHQSGQFELLPLYVARKPNGPATLIDSTGQIYVHGLDDFRRDNGILGSDDLILAPAEITAVPAKGQIVTVPGHYGWNWKPWLFGAVLIVLIGILTLAIYLKRKRSVAISPGN